MLGELEQVGQARHTTVIPHDFTDDAGGFQAGQPRQINSRFRVAGSAQDAAFPRGQRKHMTRANQITGSGFFIQQHVNSPGAIMGADPGCYAPAGIHGCHECGAKGVRRVGGGHLGDI